MSVEAAREEIHNAITRLRLKGCVPTMRNALMLWRDYLQDTQPSGLSTSDKEGYAAEYKRIDWLLSDIFPDEVANETPAE
jgi:hypothetical protein